jgi:hypothetical protein
MIVINTKEIIKMGREQRKGIIVQVHILMLSGLHERLERWCKETRWTKTQAIEYAVSCFLNTQKMDGGKK